MQSKEARLILGAAIVDDILAIAALSVVVTMVQTGNTEPVILEALLRKGIGRRLQRDLRLFQPAIPPALQAALRGEIILPSIWQQEVEYQERL